MLYLSLEGKVQQGTAFRLFEKFSRVPLSAVYRPEETVSLEGFSKGHKCRTCRTRLPVVPFPITIHTIV
jgi:hypothetical protein